MKKVKPIYEEIKIRKNVADKVVREGQPAILCDCCTKLADVEITFSKRQKNNDPYGRGRKTKVIKRWYMCPEHMAYLKSIINYF